MPLVLAGTGGRPSHPDSHRHRPRLPPNSAAASPSGLGFELFGSGPFPTESLVPSLPWLPSVKCISAVGFKTGHFCTISAPIFDFDRCSFASRHGTRRIAGTALHRGMEHFHDARTRRTQRNNRTRERTPNHANQPEREAARVAWQNFTVSLPFDTPFMLFPPVKFLAEGDGIRTLARWLCITWIRLAGTPGSRSRLQTPCPDRLFVARGFEIECQGH